MRVVEYQKSTTSMPYQLIKGVGMVAGVFSLLVCALLIANNLSIKKTDPIHSPALQQLVEKLKTNPEDQALREEIRELDQIARRAFFTSQHFNRLGIYLLVGGLLVMVVAFKSLESYKMAPPYPDSSEPKDDIVENATWARKSVVAVGLVLAGFALMIALPWESTLDIPEAEPSTADGVASAGKASEPPETAPAKPVASAEDRLNNWPGFLGPESGLTRATGLATTWDGETGDGIRWKTATPLPGFNSPIIWNSRIYLSGADKSKREVYCLDAENGEILWQNPVENIAGSPAEPPKVTDDTGYAAATMATDGLRVFAIFSNGDLVAFDLDGTLAWAKNLGIPDKPYGHSSSLAVHQDLLLVQFDQKEDSFLTGLDSATGEERWRTPREFGPSWSSPALIDTGDRIEVVLAADPMVVSYDPNDGKELWRCECLKRAEVAATPAYANGIVYVSADHSKLSAIDVKTHEVIWDNDDLTPGVSTPIVVGDYLIGGLSEGGIVCFDAKTGEEIWYEDTDDGFYASPIVAGGRVYLMSRSGVMHIFEPGPEYKSVGTPGLGEEATCTAAVLGDSLFLRGTTNLYRIGP